MRGDMSLLKIRDGVKSWLERAGQAWQAAEQRVAPVLEALIKEKPLLLLALLALVWLLPTTPTLPLMDRDEPRFAHATQEMLDSGSSAAWTVPYFNGEYRFDKPPLVYWWMRAHYTLMGYSELSARLHSIEATILVLWVIYGFGRRLFDARVGFWAAFAFLTCLQVVQHGRLCLADMPMLLFILLAQWAGWELLQRGSWRWAVVFWSALAFGFSTKWLVPWAVVGLTIPTYALITRKMFNLWNFKPVFGLALMTGLLALWIVPAWQATGGAMFTVGIGEHVFERGAQALNSRRHNPFFYLITVFVSLLPWAGGLPAIFGWVRAHWDNRMAYLVAWTVPTYILFSVAKTQLPHYTMPAFVPLFWALVAATDLRAPEGKWLQRFYHGLRGLFVLLFAVVLLVALFGPSVGEAWRVRLFFVALAASLLLLSLLGWARAQGRYLLMLTALVLSPLCFWGAAAAIRPLSPAIALQPYLSAIVAPQKLVANGFEEPSLTAYTQAKWDYSPVYTQAVATYNSSDSVALLLLAREYRLDSFGDLVAGRPLRAKVDREAQITANPPEGGRRLRFEGVNLGRFSWVVYDLYLKP
jgi:4-amino-4-deoxy-L-arabinose transferase-like glycosyltransferase